VTQVAPRDARGVEGEEDEACGRGLLPHELALEDRTADEELFGRDDLDFPHVPRPVDEECDAKSRVGDELRSGGGREGRRSERGRTIGR